MDRYQDFAKACVFLLDRGGLTEGSALTPKVPPPCHPPLQSVSDDELDAISGAIRNFDKQHWQVSDLGEEIQKMIVQLERGELDFDERA